MENTVCFFEVTKEGMQRYPQMIANKILKKYPKTKFLFIMPKECGINRSKFPSESKFFRLNKSKSLEYILQKNDVSVCVSFSHRITDLFYIQTAKQLGIKTVNFQHGILKSDMNRKILNKLKETQKIMRRLNYLSKIFGRSKDIAEVLRVILLKGGYIDRCKLSENIRSNHILVFGQYWKKFYANKFGYNMNDISVVGTFDYLKVERGNYVEDKNSVSLICQTLVEDGRISRVKYSNFINEMIYCLPDDQRLYINLHPRSDKKIYSKASKLPNVRLTRKFVLSDRYVGHFSTLLSVPLALNKATLLWKLEGHSIPEYFREPSWSVTNDKKKLSHFLMHNISQKKELNMGSYFAPFNEKKAIESIL
jgi:hypothetical protein